MAVGALQSEADLTRWLRRELQRPDTLTTGGLNGSVLRDQSISPNKLKLDGGTVKLEWVAESTASGIATVTHKLGVVPTSILLSTICSEATLLLTVAEEINGSATATQFKCKGLSALAAPKGLTILANWIALG
jgi:hypothetical protein